MLTGRQGWSEECVIRHSWNEVMRAVQNKYPNPQNNSVLSIDVLSRSVDVFTGTIQSLKLMNSSFPMFPHLGQLKAIEWSSIDREEKCMVTVSHNVDLRGVMKAVEHLEYKEHPENKNWTVVKHSVSIEAFPLIALTASSTSRQNARQGREAITWVINHRLPLLHSFPNWRWNYPRSDSSYEEVIPVPEQPEPTLSNSPSAPPKPIGRSSSSPAVPHWNWTQGVLASPVTTVVAADPVTSVDLPSCSEPEPQYNRSFETSKPRFFADLQTSFLESSSSLERSSSMESPIHRLGSHFETLTRDVTAMSDRLMRRTQRVARLFSKIDEYVVIL